MTIATIYHAKSQIKVQKLWWECSSGAFAPLIGGAFFGTSNLVIISQNWPMC